MMFFYSWSIIIYQFCTAVKMQSLKEFRIKTLTIPGVTWRHWSRDHWTRRGHFLIDGQWWPCVYLLPLWRYKTSKLRLAHLEGQKFTAHARCHVTCRQGVKNDHMFGIPDAILSIHYTTSVGLRWRL